MANTKVTQHVIANNAITADQLASAAVTDAKLHSTLDLSGKTLTLPATAIPSASTATTQAASDNSTKRATTAYVTTAIGNLVDSAPTALDTLNELAAALGDDANFSGTVTTSLAGKLPLAGGTMTGALVLSGAPTSGLHAATKTYVDTADALKLNLTGGTLTGDLILNTTTALQIPVGTTGQRPTAATGQIRWNSTDGAIEVYNGTAWTGVGTGSSNKVLDTFTGDGSTTTFTLSVTPANEDAIMVFIDGAYQEKSDYVLTNNSLVLDTAPLSAEKIAVHITTAAVHDGTSAVNNQFTATAGQTAFTLTQDPSSENNTQVYINGVYQQKTDYTVVGTTLTFDTGLTVGDVVEVNMFTVATLGNTDTVTEGVSNLYHTTARARGAISVSGNALSYNSSTGVITANFEESPTFTGNVQVSGSLGVGGSPSFPLHINSSSTDVAKFQTSGSYAYTRFQNSSKTWALSVGSSFSFYDEAASATRMVIDTSGNVGINESNPSHRLHINGGSNDEARVRVTNTASGQASLDLDNSEGYFRTYTDAGEYRIYDQTDGTHRLVIDTSGNVGIGTSSPKDKLHVKIGTNLNWQFGYPNSTSTTLAALNDAESAYVDGRIDANQLFLNSQSGGKVGIGLTGPASMLHVKGNASSNGGIIGTFERTDSNGGWVRIKGNSTESWQIGTTGGGFEFYDDAATTYAMKINNASGNHSLQKWCYAEFDVHENNSAAADEEKANLASKVYKLYNAIIDPGKYSNGSRYIGVGRENSDMSYVEFKVDVIEARSMQVTFSVSNSADASSRNARLWYSYDGRTYTQVDNSRFGAGGTTCSYNLNLTSVLHHGDGDFSGSIYWRCGIVDNASSHLTLIGWDEFTFKAFAESMTFDGSYQQGMYGSGSSILTSNTGGTDQMNYVPNRPCAHSFTGSTFTGNVTNRTQVFSSTGQSYLDRSLWAPVTSPTNGIQIFAEGTIHYSFSQDIITSSSSSYASCNVERVTSSAGASVVVGYHLITNTGGLWDGIGGSGCFDVQPGDIIRFIFNGNNITNMDGGSWSYYNLIWFPVTTSGKGQIGNANFPWAGSSFS